jgi:hypothetical protein
MTFTLARRGSAAFGLLLLLAAGIMAIHRNKDVTPSIPAPAESKVELSISHEGQTYKVIHGAVYKDGPDPGRLTFVETLYDPDFHAKNYAVVDGVPNRRDPDTGQFYPTRRHLEEGFEDVPDLTGLIGPRRGWTTLTLQSPEAPTVPDYVALRQRILSGRGGFLDNRVEVVTAPTHSGRRSLRCYCVAPSRGMTCAKASLSTELLHFAKGDNVWFSAWFLVAADGSRPLTVADLESTGSRSTRGCGSWSICRVA